MDVYSFEGHGSKDFSKVQGRAMDFLKCLSCIGKLRKDFLEEYKFCIIDPWHLPITYKSPI